MRPIRSWVVSLGLGLGFGFGCTGASVFVCTADGDCDDGRCEPNGYCSFPDDECDSGWAYGELSAPQLAGQCVGEGEGTGDTTAGPSTTSGVTSNATTTPPPIDSGVTTDDSADASSDSDPTTSDPVTSTTDPMTSDTGECVPAEPSIVWVEDAQIVPPMQLEVAVQLPTQPLFAFSEEGGQGAVIIDFEAECDAMSYAWALVFDPIPGIGNGDDDPDSFFLSLDGGDELVWEYGCAFEPGGFQWRWVPIGSPDEQCPLRPEPVPVSAGLHTLQVRNNEGTVGRGLFAGIAGFFSSSDPNDDPNDFYPVAP